LALGKGFPTPNDGCKKFNEGFIESSNLFFKSNV